jgi:hypothetical protein
MTLHYLYKITVNRKSYIGTAVDPQRRLRDHARAKSPLGRAIRKHGLGTSTLKVLAKRRTVRAIHVLERAMIARLKTYVPQGYNLTRTGSGCDPSCSTWRAGVKRRSRSPKWRANNLAANRRNAQDPKWRAAYAAGRERMKHNPKWRAGLKRRSKSPTWRANHLAAVRRSSRRQTWRTNHLATMKRTGLARRGKPWSSARRAAQQEAE